MNTEEKLDHLVNQVHEVDNKVGIIIERQVSISGKVDHMDKRVDTLETYVNRAIGVTIVIVALISFFAPKLSEALLK